MSDIPLPRFCYPEPEREKIDYRLAQLPHSTFTRRWVRGKGKRKRKKR